MTSNDKKDIANKKRKLCSKIDLFPQENEENIDNISREIKVVNSLKSAKPQHFHELFSKKKLKSKIREKKCSEFG